MSLNITIQPENVFQYFEEISRIPRGSGDTEKLTACLIQFAAEHGLQYNSDAKGNVLIRKNGSVGYEQAKPMILQGHFDMVCEKKPESSHDFTKDGIDLCVDGDWMFGKDTTLGGDDGIAVAMMMAILTDESIPHPPLECVFTTDEEIGLLGAAAFDYSQLKGRRMINLDSEEEGTILAGCAGGMSVETSIPVRYCEGEGTAARITLTGLAGGHSGTEIHRYRANADIVMGRILHELNLTIPFYLGELSGGTKDNAIPRTAEAVILFDGADSDLLKETLQKLEQQLVREYEGIENGLSIEIEMLGAETMPVVKPSDFQKIVFYLMQVRDGIQKMSGTLENMVETSCNLGILELQPDRLKSITSVRSSIKSAKYAVAEKIIYLTEFLGGEVRISGEYPAWEFLAESPFRDTAVKIYQNVYGTEPKVEVIHAGLECGLFYESLPGLECISIGPDILDIHTTEERMSISSVQRNYAYVLELLKACTD